MKEIDLKFEITKRKKYNTIHSNVINKLKVVK